MDGYTTEEDDDLASSTCAGTVRLDDAGASLDVQAFNPPDTVEDAFWRRCLMVIAMCVHHTKLPPRRLLGDPGCEWLLREWFTAHNHELRGFGLTYEVNYETLEASGQRTYEFSIWVRNVVKMQRQPPDSPVRMVAWDRAFE